MAPEQARGEHEQIGAATDVYGLGTILFELLTGRPPFRGRNDVDILRQVVCDDAPALRGLRGEVSADLEAICAKCLEKRPARRYRTSTELAADLRRYLAGEPILARQATPAERLFKWTRRHPTAAALWSVTAIGLVVLMVGTALSNRWLRQERDRTLKALAQSQASERRSRFHLYASDLQRAQEAMKNFDAGTASEILRQHIPIPGADDLREFSWHFLWRALHRERARLPRHPADVYAVAISPDDKLLATACRDGHTRLWNYATGELLAQLTGHEGEVNTVNFSPDGSLMVTGGDDGVAIIWDVASRELKGRLVHEAPSYAPTEVPAVSSALFSPNGSLIYSAAGRELFAWRIGITNPLQRIDTQDRSITSLALSPDGSIAAVAAGVLYAFRTTDWHKALEIADLDAVPTLYKSVDISPDGRRLVAGTDAGEYHVFDLELRRLEHAIPAVSNGSAQAVDHIADRRMMICGSSRGVVNIFADERWDTHANFVAHADRIWDLKIAADGTTFVSADAAGDVLFWDVPTDRRFGLATGILERHIEPKRLHALANSTDGRYVGVIGDRDEIALLDRMNDHLICIPGPRRARHLAITSGAQQIYLGHSTSVDCYDRASQAWTSIVRGESSITGLSLSADDGILAVVTAGDASSSTAEIRFDARLLERSTGRELARVGPLLERVNCVRFSPDGGRYAILQPNVLTLYETATHRPLYRVQLAGTQLYDLAFFPDSRRLVTAEERRGVVVRDAADGHELLRLAGHQGAVHTVTVSPDGRNIASVDNVDELCVWDTWTGRILLRIDDVQSAERGAKFSPIGGHLAIVQGRGISNLTILDGRPVVIPETLPPISAGR
jgi:WD40 repeat protein